MRPSFRKSDFVLLESLGICGCFCLQTDNKRLPRGWMAWMQTVAFLRDFAALLLLLKRLSYRLWI